MAVEVMVPRLGWSMDSGVFGEWLKKDGDAVAPGEVLFSIEADKAVEEVESEDEGILRILPGVAEPGVELTVGTVIGWLVAEGETVPQAPPMSTAARAQKPGDKEAPPVPVTPAAPVISNDRTPAPSRGSAASSPRARRVARELGVDWWRATGTGRQGRIVERDVHGLADGYRMEGDGPSTLRTLRVDADPFELTVLLDRLVESGEELERSYLYRALLVRLVVAAYRLTIGRDNPRQIPRVSVGVAKGGDISFVALDRANLSSGRDTAAKIKALELDEQHLADADAGVSAEGNCLRIVDLGMFGIDEYTPGGHSRCPLLSFGRIRAGSSSDEQVSDCGTVRIVFSFGAGTVDLVSGAAFVQKVCAAVEKPLAFLAL